MKDIHSQIPEITQLYYFGTAPCSEASASSLIKELQRSPLTPPVTDHTKSNSGMLVTGLLTNNLFVLSSVIWQGLLHERPRYMCRWLAVCFSLEIQQGL